MGLLFAILAIAGWSVGDFLIQRSARRMGDWEALFFITFFATIVLFPFVYHALAALTAFDWLVLTGTSIVILVAALLDFDALRVGKMSVIAPIYAMEVPITIALATFVLGEALSAEQVGLVVLLLIGIFLVSNKHLTRSHIRTLERGVWYAVLATIGMGMSNFLYAFSARETGPLMINWFTSAFMALATLAYLLNTGQGRDMIHSWKKNKKLILSVGLMDNMAWVSYSASTLFLPIGLATGLTESYIAFAAILGVIFNREKLAIHQKAGLALTVCCAILLAFISPELG